MHTLINSLRSVYAFLRRHTFYPMLLYSILGLGMFAVRVLMSGSTNFANLPWNLLLAWIPYLCSLWAASLHARNPDRWRAILLPTTLWLLFFPNAPYIVTDFLHLWPRPHIPLWYDILLLATYAWTGLFLGFASLRTMQNVVVAYLGAVWSWLFVGWTLTLGSLGIYLGRFSRWNSWDIFSNPQAILKDIADQIFHPLSNKEFYAFTLTVTAFLLAGYLTFASVRGLNEPQHGELTPDERPPAAI